jgi:hypothetical protein
MPWWAYANWRLDQCDPGVLLGLGEVFRAIREWEDERYERFGMC